MFWLHANVAVCVLCKFVVYSSTFETLENLAGNNALYATMYDVKVLQVVTLLFTFAD